MARREGGEGRLGPVARRVLETLRRRVMHGQYAPGALMPAERDLAAELGASRMSVSRALGRLAAEGIVEQRTGVGTRVLPGAAERLPPGRVAVVRPAQRGRASSEGTMILQGVLDGLARQQRAFDLLAVGEEGTASGGENALPRKELGGLPLRYGGAVFVEAMFREAILDWERRKAPVVVANMEQDLEACATWVDHAKVARSAVELLAAMGHRRIGLVATDPRVAFYAKTLAGFREAMGRLGLAVNEHWVAFTPASSALDAYGVAKRMLKGRGRPTGIVAGRDSHAEGVCRAAEEMGLVVGRDVSVVGFDDLTWPREARTLTTFREPCYEMGFKAAEMLVERMDGGWRPPEKRETPAPLVLRRSVGPPAEVAGAAGDAAMLLMPVG
ncbi:MAG TPA: substrate-binding domain-containing protein [Candidatus Brocadiia bacterium]|nr:substrate-binding domain-containing protein [Candidatus Brocadiia bacterium]